MRDVIDDATYADLIAAVDEAIGILLEYRELAAFDPTIEVPSLWELTGGNGRLLASLERALERALALAGVQGEA
jgi:hypothetical protein